MDRAKFFASAKASVFGGSLKQSQVDGINAILDGWATTGITDNRQIAYVLGTAFHESAHTMQPVRETLAATDDQAIARLEFAWKKGQLKWVKTPYWRKDSAGKSWFGRGLVQITHKANYEKFGLAGDPSKALDMAVAVKVLIRGMVDGMFTGHKLSGYFHGDVADWTGARKIVNGTDKAATIAAYSKNFYKALGDTPVEAQAQPSIPVQEESPVREDKPAVIVNGPAPGGNWLAALLEAILKIFARKP